MKKVTFENKFHNTEITMIPKTNRTHEVYLSEGQLTRLKRELCGSKECTCSGHISPRIGADGEVIDYKECECCGYIGGKEDFASSNNTGDIYMCNTCWDDGTLTDTLE